MSDEFSKFPKPRTIHVENSLGGIVWLVGWFFTIGFVKLVWWQAFLAIVIWPYYLGDVLRIFLK
jgi:hypothetical protein